MSNPLNYGGGSNAVVEENPAQRTQAMIAHLLGIITLIGPGIFYLIKKDDATTSPFVKSQLKEVINWGITVWAAMIAVYILMFILLFISTTLAMVVSLLAMAIGIGNLVLVIVSAMKANKGIAAKYPYTFKILK